MGPPGKWLKSLVSGKKQLKTSSRETAKSSPTSIDKERTPAQIGHEKLQGSKSNRWNVLRSCSFNDKAALTVLSDDETGSVSFSTASAAGPLDVSLETIIPNSCGYQLMQEEWAAIRIQTAYRGFLARKALRALKGLMRLQAMVRGHAVQKQAAATFRCMQALVRVQCKVHAHRERYTSKGQQEALYRARINVERHRLQAQLREIEEAWFGRQRGTRVEVETVSPLRNEERRGQTWATFGPQGRAGIGKENEATFWSYNECSSQGTRQGWKWPEAEDTADRSDARTMNVRLASDRCGGASVGTAAQGRMQKVFANCDDKEFQTHLTQNPGRNVKFSSSSTAALRRRRSLAPPSSRRLSLY